MYNHLESGKCQSGIDHSDIKVLASRYLRSQAVSNNVTFFCRGCCRQFQQMCDLLQHAETSSCGESYCRGSGSLGSLVRYIEGNISNFVKGCGQHDGSCDVPAVVITPT